MTDKQQLDNSYATPQASSTTPHRLCSKNGPSPRADQRIHSAEAWYARRFERHLDLGNRNANQCDLLPDCIGWLYTPIALPTRNFMGVWSWA